MAAALCRAQQPWRKSLDNLVPFFHAALTMPSSWIWRSHAHLGSASRAAACVSRGIMQQSARAGALVTSRRTWRGFMCGTTASSNRRLKPVYQETADPLSRRLVCDRIFGGEGANNTMGRSVPMLSRHRAERDSARRADLVEYQPARAHSVRVGPLDAAGTSRLCGWVGQEHGGSIPLRRRRHWLERPGSRRVGDR